MGLNFHQTPEEIIKNADAEQRILWNFIFLRFGTKLGLSQLLYCGAIAGSEFVTYNARKMYVALSLQFDFAGVAVGLNNSVLYDEANAAFFVFAQGMPYWNATTAAANFIILPFRMYNMYFSRLAAGSFTLMRFIGYRLSI